MLKLQETKKVTSTSVIVDGVARRPPAINCQSIQCNAIISATSGVSRRDFSVDWKPNASFPPSVVERERKPRQV